MNVRLAPRFAACALGALVLAGCGTPTTPREALAKRFGANQISFVYPFHARLGARSAAYFLQLKGGTQPYSEVAILYRSHGNWSVWMYQSIPVITSCADAVSVASSGPVLLSPAQQHRLVRAGRIESSISVGSLTYVIGGHAYRASLLKDGFWIVQTADVGGRLNVRVTDSSGRPVPACTVY